ncbi:hypothetical protein GCM10027341_46140 [Spirosoma knui]
MKNLPYIRLETQDPRHRQLIQAAIKVRDTMALESLQDCTSKPIEYITGWFYYELMKYGNDGSDAILIYSPQTRAGLLKLLKLETKYKPIPENTYDFLK